MSDQRALAEELREYTAMKYAGDCKCGKCQLVPRALVERIYHTLNSAGAAATPAPERDGWEYQAKPDGGDCRKIVTLDQDGMCWVGIRAFNATTGQWLNGGEPERAKVLAWRDLDQPARGRWVHGKLLLGRVEFSLEGTGFTLKECGCTEGFCDGLTDGTCTVSRPEPAATPARTLSDFTDAEIATEHGWRMQCALGDQRTCVETEFAPATPHSRPMHSPTGNKGK